MVVKHYESAQEMAEELQSVNRFARKVYLTCFVALVVLSIVLLFIGDPYVILTAAIAVFFIGLAAYNERIIRRFRKAGIK